MHLTTNFVNKVLLEHIHSHYHLWPLPHYSSRAEWFWSKRVIWKPEVLAIWPFTKKFSNSDQNAISVFFSNHGLIWTGGDEEGVSKDVALTALLKTLHPSFLLVSTDCCTVLYTSLPNGLSSQCFHICKLRREDKMLHIALGTLRTLGNWWL